MSEKNQRDPIATGLEQITSAGSMLIRGVFSPVECTRFAEDLHSQLLSCDDDKTSLRRGGGVVYGARNLLDLFPAARTLWRKPVLLEILHSVLGPRCGLVRGLFFDKPPDANWSLPWHRDLTISVTDHSLPSAYFCNRTVKAGVPHVEAPDELLRQMLTLRIHLDDVTLENGPLQVLSGTHLSRAAAPTTDQPSVVLATAGDVFVMRPLLSHSSLASREGTLSHRRTIHLEFAATPNLPDGYRWWWFFRV